MDNANDVEGCGFLLFEEPVKFHLHNLGVTDGEQKSGEVDVDVEYAFLRFYFPKTPPVSYKLWDSPEPDKRMASLKIRFSDFKGQLCVEIEGELLQQIKNLFGSGVRVELNIGKSTVNGIGPSKLKKVFKRSDRFRDRTCEMEIVETEDDSGMAFCEDEIAFPEGWKKHWLVSSKPNPQFTANLTLAVIIDRQEQETYSIAGALETNKKLLEEGVGSDLTVVAENGIGVKCHSMFLAGQSEILKRMLESGKGCGTIKVPDVSEEAVRAFLAYLYYKDLSKPTKCCSVAVELIQIGHKYQVNGLENEMKKILLAKSPTWFDPGFTLRLFLFVDKLDIHEDIKQKSVQMLKLKSAEFRESPEYQRLFQLKGDAEPGTVVCFDDHAAQLGALKGLFNALLV